MQNQVETFFCTDCWVAPDYIDRISFYKKMVNIFFKKVNLDNEKKIEAMEHSEIASIFSEIKGEYHGQ